jgi:hypothetical protein
MDGKHSVIARPEVAFRPIDLWALIEPERATPACLQAEAQMPDRLRLDAARIARDPRDIEAHTTRVLLQCQAAATDRSGQQARLFEALVDLFLALGTQGPELRAGLLARARPWLAAEQHGFLARYLAAGLSKTDTLPPGTHARLDAGAVGRVDMVRRHQAPAQPPRPALEQAIDLVDRGDIAAAQALLESALLANPTDGEVAEELRQLYRLNGDAPAAQAMATRLRESGLPVPEDWPVV